MINNNIIENKYIKDYHLKNYNLSNDILKNGTHWPLLVFSNQQIVNIFEGRHRIEALQNNPQTKNKYFLCFLISNKFVHIHNVHNFLMRKSINEFVFIPEYLKYDFIKGKIKKISYDKKHEILKINTLQDLINIYLWLPIKLANKIYENKNFKGFKGFNDKNEFKKFYNIPYLIYDNHEIVDEEKNKYPIQFFNFDEYMSLKNGQKQIFFESGLYES